MEKPRLKRGELDAYTSERRSAAMAWDIIDDFLKGTPVHVGYKLVERGVVSIGLKPNVHSELPYDVLMNDRDAVVRNLSNYLQLHGYRVDLEPNIGLGDVITYPFKLAAYQASKLFRRGE